MFKFINKLVGKIKSLFGFKNESQPNLDENGNPLGAAPQEFRYYLVDPSFPNLIGTAVNPITYRLPFTVKFFTGNMAPFDRPQGKAANTYTVLCRAINHINKKANLAKWAVVKNLSVDPLAGIQANAFYDRQNLKFFSFTGKTGAKVDTCLSADIVTHELGHALLDSMRPEFFSAGSVEIWAFHESFGDVIAIFNNLFEPQMVAYLLQSTGGDLSKPNITSDLAEQFGNELGLNGGLRKAVNNFVYVKPQSLPQNGPDSMVSAEPHSFSRIMTGAVYEIFVKTYDSFGRGNDAVVKARDFLLETYLDAAKTAPASANFYQSFAQTWTNITSKKSPAIGKTMKDVFTARQILGQVVAQSANQLNVNINKTVVEQIFNDEEIVHVHEGTVLIKDLFVDEIIGQSEVMNEIMGLKLYIPMSEMMVAQGEGWEPVCCDVNEACMCAKFFVEYLVQKDLYGTEEHQSWYKDEEGFLVRRHISCCGDNGFINNCKVPGNPEFGKCWKCKNNTGCCTYGSCGCEEKPKPKVILPCRTRYNTCSATRYNTSCGATRYQSQPYGNNSAQAGPVPNT